MLITCILKYKFAISIGKHQICLLDENLECGVWIFETQSHSWPLSEHSNFLAGYSKTQIKHRNIGRQLCHVQELEHQGMLRAWWVSNQNLYHDHLKILSHIWRESMLNNSSGHWLMPQNIKLGHAAYDSIAARNIFAAPLTRGRSWNNQNHATSSQVLNSVPA